MFLRLTNGMYINVRYIVKLVQQTDRDGTPTQTLIVMPDERHEYTSETAEEIAARFVGD
jgi:hypothetical protein